MKIALVGISFPDECTYYIQEMINTIQKEGHDIFISEPFYKFLIEKKTLSNDFNCIVFTKNDNIVDIDFYFSIGGDGTFLETITYVGNTEVPILGINTGRLGFLAIIDFDKIKNALTCLMKGNYSIDSRSLLEITMNNNVFENKNFALNEISISKRDTSSMITVHTKIDGEFLNVYWADGLIISTPTGSTGYSLSCGGPIMMPRTENFVIAPINPHNLSARPLIISDTSSLELYVETISKNYLVTLDSRSEAFEKSIVFSIKKANFQAKLVNIHNNTYIKTLKKKLNWGFDLRN